MNKFAYILFGFSMSLLIACSNDTAVPAMKVKPNAMGSMNEIVIICDELLWKSQLKDSLDFHLAGAYPIMPRPEEIFDLKHYTFEDLQQEPLRKELRTYLIIGNTSDPESAVSKMIKKDIGDARFNKSLEDGKVQTSIGYNKWATNQMLIYYFANDEDLLISNVRNAFPVIEEKVLAHDKGQLQALVYARGENQGISNKLKSKFNVDLKIPFDFKVVKEIDQENFLWIRKDENDATLCMVFKELDYKGPSQLTKENAKLFSNDFGKRYITGDSDGSYLTLNDVDLPMFEYTKNINGNFAKEFRGIWEMENDFMGGPFIDYFIVDEANSKLLFLMTFVYAPGKSKRDMVQGLDYLAKNIEFLSGT